LLEVPLHEGFEFWVSFVIPPSAPVTWGLLPARVDLGRQWVSALWVMYPLVPSYLVGWPPPPMVTGPILCVPPSPGVPLCLAKVAPLRTWPLRRPLWQWALATPCQCRSPPRDDSPPIVRGGADLPLPLIEKVGPLDWDGIAYVPKNVN
jgi:hypothetical protein